MTPKSLERIEPLLSEAAPVVVRRCSEPALKALAQALTELRSQIAPYECFYNAQIVAERCDPVDYVEGFVIFDDAVVPHAWNAIGDSHFDLTWEFHWPEALGQPHLALIRGKWPTLTARGYRFDPERSPLIEQVRARK